MNRWVPALRLTGVGFFIAVCIVGGALIGLWLGDRNPLFILLGLVVGLAIAVYGVYRMIKPLMNNHSDKEKS